MSVLSVISDLIEAILSTPGTILVSDVAEAAPLPDGWPPFYDRHLLEDGPYAGRYVVTVKCAVTGRVARTSLPAWFTEEDARGRMAAPR